jgi:Na+/H+ antiporter NhaD/arsenite permease-like protein
LQLGPKWLINDKTQAFFYMLSFSKAVFCSILGYITCISTMQASVLPRALDYYADGHLQSLSSILGHRIAVEPFNAIATLIFLLAIIHTFCVGYFQKKAHKLEAKHQEALGAKGLAGSSQVCFKAQVFHFFGEVEAIFGIWIIPLMLSVIYYHGFPSMVGYFENLNFTEPLFVVIIMAIASTQPVLYLSEKLLGYLALLGKGTVVAWWFVILTAGPILGSFITEPAAMTIAALMLAQKFYELQPSTIFKYATLGLLFVNISVGGTLTHFAAPPILMVAAKWGFTLKFTFLNMGLHACAGILATNCLFLFLFRKEFRALELKQAQSQPKKPEGIPTWVIGVHLFFLAWTVIFLHTPALYIGGFLFFVGFMQATAHHQEPLSLRGPLLVGFFLAGLVTHGGLQQWWIEPLLSRLGATTLYFGSIVLTAFNDNAAITYLASLVPSFQNNLDLQIAVVEGAVTGGGLTVIANAPNPAGQSILSKYFPEGVSPLKLFLGALGPTIIMIIFFRYI